MRRRLMVVIAAMLLSGAVTVGRAQSSPYLPLDHPAYAYVDALMDRGHLATLWRLERPYRIAELTAALESDSVALRAVLAGWRRSLERALGQSWDATAERGAAPTARVSGELFVTAQSSAQRELMLADTVSGVYPGFGVTGTLASGRVLLLGRVAFDRRLRTDPDFAGKKDRALIGRNVEGYASAEWQHGELFFGRTGRSWGPPRLRGLQLGDAPYGYDHLYARLGSARVRFSTLLARLDDWTYRPDSIASRYFAVHRLALRVRGVEIAGTETMLFGGVGRGLEFAYANPLTVYDGTQYNENQQGNINVGLEASTRLGRWGVVAAQGMLDDLQVDECGPSCQEPPSYGITFTWDGLTIAGGHALFGSYTRLTALAYRTPAMHEQYDYRGVGLGHAFTDYDELRLGADLALFSAAVLRPYLARRRQGEGDYRLPFPSPAEYAATPTFLAGTVMKVTRVGLTARGAVGGRIGIDADVGMNRVTNARHVAGAQTSEIEGRIVVRVGSGSLRW